MKRNCEPLTIISELAELHKLHSWLAAWRFGGFERGVPRAMPSF